MSTQGMRDATALAAALARPQQKYVYDPDTEIAQLAAAYAFGVAMSHPYSDGNKRTAFLVAASERTTMSSRRCERWPTSG